MKAAKERLMMILCGNASGDCAGKPLLPYHSQNPRAFKGKKRITCPPFGTLIVMCELQLQFSTTGAAIVKSTKWSITCAPKIWLLRFCSLTTLWALQYAHPDMEISSCDRQPASFSRWTKAGLPLLRLQMHFLGHCNGDGRWWKCQYHRVLVKQYFLAVPLVTYRSPPGILYVNIYGFMLSIISSYCL